MKACCVFSLESGHRGDSNEDTQYTIFNLKKKIALNYPKSAAMGFPRGTQTRVLNSHGKRAISVRAIEVLLYCTGNIFRINSLLHLPLFFPIFPWSNRHEIVLSKFLESLSVYGTESCIMISLIICTNTKDSDRHVLHAMDGLMLCDYTSFSTVF